MTASSIFAPLLAALTAVSAKAATPDSFAGVTEAQLRAGAAKEGRVLVYAIPLSINDTLAAAFRKKYPEIDLEVLKAGGTQLLEKFELEQDRGAASADCISSGLAEAFPDLRRKGYLADLTSVPNWTKRPAWSKDGAGAYFYYANFKVGLAYNTKLVSAAEAPDSFAALAQPQWRQKVVLFDTTAGFTIPLFRFLIEKPALGWRWVEQLKANDPLMAANAAQVDDAVVSGRRAVAIVRDTEAISARRRGAPIDFRMAKEGFMLHMLPIAVNARAAHPYAARLFVNWLLSDEARNLLAEQAVGVPLDRDEKALKAAGGWYQNVETVDPRDTSVFIERLNAVLHRR